MNKPTMRAVQQRPDYLEIEFLNEQDEVIYAIGFRIDSWEPGRKALSVCTDDAVHIAPFATNAFNLIL